MGQKLIVGMQYTGTVHGAYGSHQALGPDGRLVWNKTLQTFYKVHTLCPWSHHSETKTLTHINESQCDYMVQVFTSLAVGFSKVSVLLLYRRIFSVRVFKTVATIGVAIAIAWTVAFTISTIFQCNPIRLYWTELEFLWGNRCIQIIPFYQAQAITDIITDFAILAMPMPMIWKLQLPLKQKLAVAGMFLLGLM